MNCKKTEDGYHEVSTIQDDWYGIFQRCTNCHKQIKVRKTPKGQLLDDDAYFEFNAKDFLQSGTREFERIYGKKASDSNMKQHKDIVTNKVKKKEVQEEIIEHAMHYRGGRIHL